MTDLVASNLLSPLPLAFALGVIARVIRSDLTIPREIYAALGIYLLLSLGLHGGAELARTPLHTIAGPAAGMILLGLVTPVIAFTVLRSAGRFSVSDSAGIAAHYGSVSAVTFIAAGQFLAKVGTPVEPFMPTLLTLLEVPGIAVALVLGALGLARERVAAVSVMGYGAGGAAVGGFGGSPGPLISGEDIARTAERVHWRETLREVLTGRTMVLLVGGLLIGAIISPASWDSLEPVFDTKSAAFKGALLVFLLEMGLVAGERMGDLRKVGLFLLGFGIFLPLLHGALGVLVGSIAGLSPGGATLVGVMAASASYIAAPPAVRLSLPDANPTYSLTLALGITFPFNLLVGIPLFHEMARLVVR